MLASKGRERVPISLLWGMDTWACFVLVRKDCVSTARSGTYESSSGMILTYVTGAVFKPTLKLQALFKYGTQWGRGW